MKKWLSILVLILGYVLILFWLFDLYNLYILLAAGAAIWFGSWLWDKHKADASVQSGPFDWLVILLVKYLRGNILTPKIEKVVVGVLVVLSGLLTYFSAEGGTALCQHFNVLCDTSLLGKILAVIGMVLVALNTGITEDK